MSIPGDPVTVDIRVVDLRDYTEGRHRVADDYPFGGGGGMVLKPEPLFAAVEARVPCLTSLDTALAVVTALRASAVATDVAPLAEYRALEAVATTAAD